jgi:hypothetical protein
MATATFAAERVKLDTRERLISLDDIALPFSTDTRATDRFSERDRGRGFSRDRAE